ncbi:MAG: hypothetical protein KGL11_11360 [Alphaproteobacteria bacterium]|nr:hypothetical protein [Alphaproteobacteria bacterium]
MRLRWHRAEGQFPSRIKRIGTFRSFHHVYRPELPLADHRGDVAHEINRPPPSRAKVTAASLYLHRKRGRAGRAIDETTERFVNAMRATAAP